MQEAGYQFSYSQICEFYTSSLKYQMGNMTIKGNTTRYWLKCDYAGGGQISIKGYGSCRSSDSGYFPQLSVHTTPLARSDPRILYKNPETGEFLKWPDWKKELPGYTSGEKWKNVEMMLTDGSPLCLVYSGRSYVDPTDILDLFEKNGLTFCVSAA